jgi:hypothetical protein
MIMHVKFIEVALLIVIWEDSVRQSEFSIWQVGLLNDFQRQEAGQLLDSEKEWI